jgi:nucleoside-triphosphatase
MSSVLLLTGRPGIGKTTVITRAAELLGERADGFYTEEIRVLGQRQGFQLIGLHGEQATLAHVKYKGRQYPRVGRYGVDVMAFDRIGGAVLKRAVAQGKIVIVDEIGKMELFSKLFKDAVLAAVQSKSPVIATIMARPNPWADALKGQPNITLWPITVENRDEMPARIVNWLRAVDGAWGVNDDSAA